MNKSTVFAGLALLSGLGAGAAFLMRTSPETSSPTVARPSRAAPQKSPRPGQKIASRRLPPSQSPRADGPELPYDRIRLDHLRYVHYFEETAIARIWDPVASTHHEVRQGDELLEMTVSEATPTALRLTHPTWASRRLLLNPKIETRPVQRPFPVDPEDIPVAYPDTIDPQTREALEEERQRILRERAVRPRGEGGAARRRAHERREKFKNDDDGE